MSAFVRHDPATPIALVLDSPHSGEDYPEDFDYAAPHELVRNAEDTHVARLWSFAPRHGATLLEARFPRAYIDPNRALTDIDPDLFAAGERWPAPVQRTRKTEQGVGLVWRLARIDVPLYARGLTVAEVQGRIERCWRPYHDALAGLLDARHREFGAVWHLDCHSMPAIGDAMSDDPGRERADFVLGDRDGTTCDPSFTALCADTLRGLGYSVAINDPYKGVEIVRVHGRPGEGRHSLQVEIKRTLYMDEATLAPATGYRRLSADLERLLEAVAGHVRERTRSHPVVGPLDPLRHRC